MTKLGEFWRGLFGPATSDKDQPPVDKAVQQVVPPAEPVLPLADRGSQRPIIPASIHGMDMSRGKL